MSNIRPTLVTLDPVTNAQGRTVRDDADHHLPGRHFKIQYTLGGIITELAQAELRNEYIHAVPFAFLER